MITILCIGDSNTYGYDPRSYYGSRYSENIRWTGLLESPDRKIINCGMNGLSVPTGQTCAFFDDLIQKYKPDLITIMLGTNDLLNGSSAEKTAAGMSSFLTHLLSQNNNPKILLLSPPHLQAGEWVQSQDIIRESLLLGDLYKSIAEKNGHLFADTADWNIDVLFDGVHFSPEGHRKFAEKLSQLPAIHRNTASSISAAYTARS